MAKPLYVIENSAEEFWDGAFWVPEYPDAMVYSSRPIARKAANHLSAVLEDSVLVIKNYGMDNEETYKITSY
jgi:hypothetical protein